MKQKLFLFFALAGGMLASPAHAQSSWTAPHPTGSTLTTSTAYYLYNKGAKEFMTNGNDYGTQAMFGSSTSLTVTAKTSGDYYRFTTTSGMLFYDGSWLYVDGDETNRGTACDFTVTSTEAGDNAYTITSFTVGTGTYIGYNGAVGSSGERIQPALSSDAGENIEWLFVSESDYSTYQATATERWDLYNALVNAEEMGFTNEDAYTAAGEAYTNSSSSANDLASATAALLAAMEAVATPGDMTEVTSQYITDPNFTDANSEGKWYVGTAGSGTAIGTSTSGWWLQNNAIYTNGDASLVGWFAEAWVYSDNGTLSDNGVSQTLSSLPAGEYRLQADIMATWQGDATVQPSGVYLFAGSAQTEVLTANGLPETYTLDFEVAEGSSNDVVIGVKTASTNVNWAGADNFKLYYIGTQLHYDTYELEQLIAEAKAILNESYNGYDEFSAAISTAESALSSTTAADIEAAIATLEEAIATYKTLNASKFDDAVGTEITITNPDASDGTTGWTTTTNVTTTYNQHWSDRAWRKYFEDGFDNYESAAPWEESMYQKVSITDPGVYKLTAAGRSSTYAKTTLVAGDMEYVFPADGDTGGTIDVDGNTWPSVAAGIAAGATFARDNAGYGWNWGSIEVIVSSEDVENGLTIGARFEHTGDAIYQYCSITDFKLEYIGAEDATLDKDVLALTIADAESIDITTNVGTTAFLRSQELASAITAQIAAAQEVYENSSATVADIEGAIASLQDAVKAFDNAELNQPEAGEVFNIVMVSECSYTGYPVTFYTSASTDGGYNLGYVKDDIDPNYGQAFTFTPTTSDNVTHDGYTISFVGVDGQTHYLCLGTSTYQLRTTTTAESANVYQVVLLGDKVWGIYCPANNTYTGTESGGLFHTNDNSEVMMTEAESVTYTATFTPGDTGYATICLPFAVATLPDGVTACSPTVESEEVVTSTTVTTLAANTPYLLMGTGGGTATFTGTGTYYDTYELTNEALTGVMAADGETAEEGVYVLQCHNDDEVAFYLVTENSGEVTVPQYHAYLTTDGDSAGVKAEAFILVPGNTTGIEAVETAETGSETIYDLSGRKVSKAQKGVYIKGGKKVIIK